MADLTPKTINELPELTEPTNYDLVAVSSGGAAKRMTWSTIKSSLAEFLLPYSTGSGTISSEITTSGGPYIELQKCGKTVQCWVSINLTSGLPGGQFVTLGSLPSGFTPRFSVASIGKAAAGNMAVFLATTGGLIQVSADSTIQSGNTAYVRGALTWFVE